MAGLSILDAASLAGQPCSDAWSGDAHEEYYIVAEAEDALSITDEIVKVVRGRGLEAKGKTQRGSYVVCSYGAEQQHR